jgi:hypothetical protein
MATHARRPVEAKVKAASALTYLLGVAGLSVVNAVQETPLLISGLADGWSRSPSPSCPRPARPSAGG